MANERDDDPSPAETTGLTADTTSSEHLTATQAAHWAGVSRATIAGWIARGVLPTRRVGFRHRILLGDLEATQALEHVSGVVPVWRADRKRAGRRLRAIREATGMNQQALAAACGLSHEVISILETGLRSPRANSVRALARALQVNPARFINDEPLGLTQLTAAEAAARLDVPAARMQVWLKNGQVEGRKVSGQWRVDSVVVAELARSGRLRGRSRRLDPRYHG